MDEPIPETGGMTLRQPDADTLLVSLSGIWKIGGNLPSAQGSGGVRFGKKRPPEAGSDPKGNRFWAKKTFRVFHQGPRLFKATMLSFFS
jgi:hypothetical protein